MPKISHAVLAVAAVLVLSAAAATTASAHEFIVEGTAVENGSEAFTSRVGTSQLRGELLGTKVAITCTNFHFLAGIISYGARPLPWTFLRPRFSMLGCVLSQLNSKGESTELPNCKVAESITSVELSGEATGSPVKVTFKPKEGTTWTEFSITGASCALKKATNTITGTQTCELPSIGTEEKEHTIECLASGSSLGFDEHEATLAATVPGVALSEGLKGRRWSAD